MLNAIQLQELCEVGFTRLNAVAGTEAVATMNERIWAFHAKRGVARNEPDTWPVGFSGKNQGLRQSGLFNRFANPVTDAVIDLLLGQGTWSETEAWGPVLVTWPQPGPWQLPHKNWHFDLPAVGPGQPAAARLFGFISQVEPHGGGTLVVEGSHELVRRLVATAPDTIVPSCELRKSLNRRYPWFDALNRVGGGRITRFMIDGDEVDGVRVRVHELTGMPGDVVAMMPWTMHALSMNTSRQPRFMVTDTVIRDDQNFYPKIPRSAKRGPTPGAARSGIPAREISAGRPEGDARASLTSPGRDRYSTRRAKPSAAGGGDPRTESSQIFPPPSKLWSAILVGSTARWQAFMKISGGNREKVALGSLRN